MKMVATVYIGEWLGGAAALVSLFGAIWRLSRKLTREVRQNLSAIAANTLENRKLARRVQVLTEMQQEMNLRGTIPMREMMHKLDREVVPGVKEIQRTINGEGES